MKMIMVNLDGSISGDLSRELIKANFRVTHLGSSGGFLRSGVSTLMIGVEDDLLQDALILIRDKIRKHPDYEENCGTIYVLKSKIVNEIHS